jgi:hypothetical protein
LASSGPERLRKVANLIYKIDNNNGRYNYIAGTNADKKRRLIRQI